jgi:superoxide dismutase, Fe-Mn family
MAITLPPLPYDVAALEPYLTKENLELHYGKHHNAYVVNLNKLIEEGKVDGSKSLEEIIQALPAGPAFNNAAQIWNHTFYWNCIKPNGGGEPSGALANAIVRDFGSFTSFKEKFAGASVSQFGSGWGWLVLEKGKLSVTSTSNADLPMKHGQTALLTCDVWEHAYYPTYKNLRPKYVEVFLSNLVNWDFVAKNLAAAG